MLVLSVPVALLRLSQVLCLVLDPPTHRLACDSARADRGKNKTVCLTRGNGHRYVMVIKADGAALDLETLATELASQDRPTNFRLQTSQAVDYISGGQKINAMPEVVKAGVNYRVAPQNSIGEIMHNVVEHLGPIVAKYGLDVKAFEADDEYKSYRDEQQQGLPAPPGRPTKSTTTAR